MGQNKLSIALISIGTALIIASIALMSLVAADIIGNDGDGNSSLETITGFGDILKTPEPAPTEDPQAESEFPPGSEAPLARLLIPRVGIDAPVVIKGVDNAGVMQSPDNAWDVAWYDFSGQPGFGGNAVFSGHVDYINVGRAVFWNLKDLQPNDVIEVRLEDGTLYRYAVTDMEQVDAASAPVDQIVGPTPKESITLITCSGTFNASSRQYDSRLIVRAERVPVAAVDTPAPDAGPGT